MRNRIRELRKARGLTLQTLADRVQACNQHISHLKTGRWRLTTNWIERLAKGLECDPLTLLGANAEEITEQELTLLNVFRTLNEDQRKAFVAAAVALGIHVPALERVWPRDGLSPVSFRSPRA